MSYVLVQNSIILTFRFTNTIPLSQRNFEAKNERRGSSSTGIRKV